MKKFKKIIIILAALFVVVLILVCVANLQVSLAGKNLIKEKIENLEEAQVVIAFGALVYDNGNLSDAFRDRVDTALEVYEAGKAKKILVSGDHGRVEYDEVNAAKKYLLDKGVAEEDIFLDHAGFDTYDSLYRADYIFKIKKAIISTQESHLPRALYIAERLGLEVEGIKADKHIYVDSVKQTIREKLANVKAFFNVSLKSKPKYLGKEINIEGDGQRSWD